MNEEINSGRTRDEVLQSLYPIVKSCFKKYEDTPYSQDNVTDWNDSLEFVWNRIRIYYK